MRVEVVDMTIEIKEAQREAREVDAYLKYEKAKLFKNQERIVKLTVMAYEAWDKFWRLAYEKFPAVRTATNAQVQSGGSIKLEIAD